MKCKFYEAKLVVGLTPLVLGIFSWNRAKIRKRIFSVICLTVTVVTSGCGVLWRCSPPHRSPSTPAHTIMVQGRMFASSLGSFSGVQAGAGMFGFSWHAQGVLEAAGCFGLCLKTFPSWTTGKGETGTNVFQVLHELSKTGLRKRIGRRQPKYWSNTTMQSTRHPAVIYLSKTFYS